MRTPYPGKLQSDDAALIMRAVALAQAEEQTSPDLLAAFASDAVRQLISYQGAISTQYHRF